MSQSSEDAGLIAVLLERLEKQHIPRALELKDKVDLGDRLNEYDLAFLKEALADAASIEPILARHPEHQELAARIMNLYKQITDKALENEKQSQGSGASEG